MFSSSPGQESQKVFQAAFPMDGETVKTKVGDDVRTAMTYTRPTYLWYPLIS